MNTLSTLSAGFLWGGFLSLLHFGMLWVSLTLMPRMPRPQLWFFGGLLARFTFTLAGMWLSLQQGPQAVMAACTGFYLVRMIIVPKLGGIWRQRGHHA